MVILSGSDRGNSSLVLQNKAAHIILDLPPYHPSTDALARLAWKPLEVRRSQHRVIFMYKRVNNMFLHNFDYKESRDIHGDNTRRNKDIRKSKSKTYWGQWTTINRSVDDWNTLVKHQILLLLREDFETIFLDNLPPCKTVIFQL